MVSREEVLMEEPMSESALPEVFTLNLTLPDIFALLESRGFTITAEVNPARVDETRNTENQSFVTFHVSKRDNRSVTALRGLMTGALAEELDE